jgi:signal transduction histidine kinase
MKRTQPGWLAETVVVVDDDRASLALCEQILSASGQRNVLLFEDPATALESIDPRMIDLLIVDLQMPEIDGLELLQRIREGVPEDDFVPVLVVTSDPSSETRRRALAFGADDFLTKPIDLVEMSLRVRHLLRLRAMHAELRNSNAALELEVNVRTGELQLAMDRLENLVRAKDVFLASVSHELRTPLTAVLGFAMELADHCAVLSLEEVAGAARTIAEQAADLSAIIDDLLVAARSDINAVQVFKQQVQLDQELMSVLDVLPADDRSRIYESEAEVSVQGDRLRIRQIMRNLLTNALRHGGDKIRVDLTSDGVLGSITVIDDGPGISPRMENHLFEPYFHGTGDSGQPDSIGLGLTVSRLLARLMDGDLELVDHPEGTAFRLALPVD